MVGCRALLVFLAAAVAAILLIACNGDDGASSPTPAGTAAPSATAPPAVTSTAGPPVSGTPGGGDRASTVIDLATTAPALTIYAADPPAGAQQGDFRNDIPSVAVGDFNGDGTDDLLLGARFADGPDDSRADGGEAYVIFGRSELPTSIDIAKSEQDVTIYGEKPGDNLGYSVAATDLNDDGIEDIVVSSPFSEGILDPDYRTDRGEAYVIFGRSDLPKTIDIAQEPDGPQDVTVIAAEGFSLLGDSIATADVNDDGIEDLVLGAPFAGREPGSPHGGPRTELGEVYVIFGSKSPESIVHIPERQEDFTVVGPEQYSELGDAVAAGDVNGDGVGDLILIGEAADWPDRDNVGVAYVLYGSEDLGGLRELAKGAQDVTIVGRDADDALGFCVSSGDVNDDGKDDILLVAQRADGVGERKSSGEADIVLGKDSLKDTIDVAKDEQDVTIPGALPADLLSACSADHDVNGDGVDDILLGTGFAGPDVNRDGAGQAYIIFGRKELPSTIDLAGRVDVIVIGAEQRDRLGSAVTAGDINGDDREELILAAPEADGPDNSRKDAGEFYVVTSLQ